MTELNCNAKNCLYNAKDCCCKGDIKVEGKDSQTSERTCCGSFKEKKGETFLNSVCHPDRAIDIDCEAVKCMYNEQHKCMAGHVGIAGGQATDSAQTECSSFKAK